MEDIRPSRAVANGGRVPGGGGGVAGKTAAYDDVFGGPPRYAAGKDSGDHYLEIFGGFAASCNIPFLELPKAIDAGFDARGSVKGPGFDYGEIFGGFDAGEFGVSYEELFGEEEAEEDGEALYARNQRQQSAGEEVFEEISHSPEGPDGEFMASSEKSQLFSDFQGSNDGSKQFNMSYHKVSRGSVDDAYSGATHVTQLSATPGFTVVVNACSSSENVEYENPPSMVTCDVSTNGNFNGGVTVKEQENMSPFTSSVNSTKSTVHDHKDDKQSTTLCPDSEDVPANMEQHSRSSSFHSVSSGDVSYPDVTFVTVSDISLRTQPLQVPPPTKPPPKLRNKHGHPKVKMAANSKADLNDGSLCRTASNGVSRRCESQEGVKGSSPSFYDVEMDARSAAAASAAAMKEAMEQAQARLKSAKELMERKRESLQSRKKLTHHEGIKFEAKTVEENPQEGKGFKEITASSLIKEDKRMNSFVVVGGEKSIRTDQVGIDCQKKESHAVQGARQTQQGKECDSFHLLDNFEKFVREDELVTDHQKKESHGAQGAQQMPRGRESNSSQVVDNLGKSIRADEIVSDQKEESHTSQRAQNTLQGKESKPSQVLDNFGKSIGANEVVPDHPKKESCAAQGIRQTPQGKGSNIRANEMLTNHQKKESHAAHGAQQSPQEKESDIRADEVVTITDNQKKENHAARLMQQGMESESSLVLNNLGKESNSSPVLSNLGKSIRSHEVVTDHQKDSRAPHGARQMPQGKESKLADEVVADKQKNESLAAEGARQTPQAKEPNSSPVLNNLAKPLREDGVVTDHQKDGHATQEARQRPKWKDFKSSEVLEKLEKTGQWKTDNEFYELTHSGMKFEIVKDVSEWESMEKKSKAMTAVVEDGENESKVVEATQDSKKTRKHWMVSETCVQEESVKKVSVGSTACREEDIKDILSAIRETFVQEENLNKLQEDDDSTLLEDDGKKLKEIQMVCSAKLDARLHDEGALSACKQGEKISEPSNDGYNHGKVHVHKEDNKKTEYVKVLYGYMDDAQELRVTCDSPDTEESMQMSNKTDVNNVDEMETKVPYGSCVLEAGGAVKATQEASDCGDIEETKEASTLESYHVQNEINLSFASKVLQHEDSHDSYGRQELCKMENDKKLDEFQEAHKLEENVEIVKAAEEISYTENGKKIEAEKPACADDIIGKMAEECQLNVHENEENQKGDQVPCKAECSNTQSEAEGEDGHKEQEQIVEIQEVVDMGEHHSQSTSAEQGLQRTWNVLSEIDQQGSLLEKKANPECSIKDAEESQCTTTTRTIPDIQIAEGREETGRIESGREQEAERARKLEEERERETEREKDRKAVERATREAHERARAEARERAERIAVGRVTAEARQRAFAEAREKAEKASAEALEKSLAEKASREARLRAERAAVDRATAEARERAVERARAEKAALDARERTEKSSATYRDRVNRDNEAGDFYRASNMEDTGARTNPTANNVPTGGKFQNAGSNSQRSSGSYNHASNGKFEATDSDSPLRCKARLERHQRTVERARKALAEKNMRDMFAQREQAERNRLSDSLDAEVRRWSNAKEGNLRALLSTLQYILGPESGWKPIPLTEVITAAAVKKAYRKATLCVHPDKLQQRGASIQQKYICEKVFDLLKDAWNRFNSEER